jgi:integrase
VRGAPCDLIPATRGQLAAVSDALGERGALALWIMHGTGMRVGECLALRADDFSADSVLVARQLGRDGNASASLKASKPHTVPIIPALRKRITEHVMDAEAIGRQAMAMREAA